MNKFKKIGVTALAGSLAAISAQAGELTVSGSAILSYVTETHSAVANRVGGNGLGMKNNVAFSGSGEVNGMNVTFFTALTDAAGGISSSALSFDMGDAGTIRLDQGTGGNGIDALDDPTPYVWEEASDGMGGANGSLPVLAGDGSANVINYTNTVAGLGLNLAYDPRVGDSDTADGDRSGDGTGSAMSATVTLPEMVEGLSLAVGYGTASTKNGTTTAEDKNSWAASAKYSMGPVTVGYNMSETNGGAAGAASNIVTGAGITFMVNENMSIGYGQVENEYANVGAHVTEKSTAIAATYTMGGATLAVQQNDQDNGNGTSGKTEERTEINLSFAF